MLENNEIRYEHYVTLKRQLEGAAEPLVTDGHYINDIRKQMRAIANDETGNKRQRMLTVTNKAAKQIGLKISQQDYTVIDNRATQLLANTPQARQAKIYSRVINQFADADDILSKILPGAHERAALIAAQFESMIEDGMLPVDAFNLSIAALVNNEQISLRKIPPFLHGTNKKTFDKWTEDDVNAQLEETNKKFKGKASTWAFERLKIRMLRAYIEKKTAAAAAAENAKKDANDETSSTTDYRRVAP